MKYCLNLCVTGHLGLKHGQKPRFPVSKMTFDKIYPSNSCFSTSTSHRNNRFSPPPPEILNVLTPSHPPEIWKPTLRHTHKIAKNDEPSSQSSKQATHYAPRTTCARTRKPGTLPSVCNHEGLRAGAGVEGQSWVEAPSQVFA